MLISEKDVSYFLSLAKVGGHSYASSGEIKARKLLQAMTVDAPGLDDRAMNGAAEFLRMVAANPGAALKLAATAIPD